MTTIIGLFTDSAATAQARQAIIPLIDGEANLHIFEKGAVNDLRASLSGLDIDGGDLDALAGSLDRGACIIVALTPSERADDVVREMTKNGAKGVDAYDREAQDDNTQRLQVAEETMGVVKSSTSSGIRARTRVTERPVQQTVTLKSETVDVNHRNADRDLDADEAEAAFQENTVEVSGVSEEAEVRKAARLIGEVEITKNSQSRQETVRDTVRKTDVETEKIGSDTEKSRRS